MQAILKRLHNQPSVKTESPSGLQKLLDVTQECIRSLQVLGRPVDTWDDLLVFLVVEKLDSNSRREWAMTLKGSELPSFKDLQCFLDLHIRVLQASGDHLGSHSNAKYKSNGNQMGGDKRHAQSHLGVSGGSCQVCKSAHLLHQCSKFQQMTMSERVAVVNSSSLCINCLRPGHWANKCKTSGVCKFCKKKHNSLLHRDSEHKENHASSSSKGSGSEGAVRSVVSSHCSLNQVLLKTALVAVTDQFGKKKTLRALLDDGSQGSFMTEICAQGLGLQVQKTDVTIRGISAAPVCSVNGQVSLVINSLVTNASVKVTALVGAKVTGLSSTQKCCRKSWNHLEGLQLADPTFHTPSKIDILLGSMY